MAEEYKSSFNEINEFNENGNGKLSDPITNCDSKAQTVFGETVLSSRECISRLPDVILNLLYDYERGLLPTTSKEEVQDLMRAWFNNEPISEQSTITGESIPGQPTSQFLKRRRVSGDL
jgi:hypothetical protein